VWSAATADSFLLPPALSWWRLPLLWVHTGHKFQGPAINIVFFNFLDPKSFAYLEISWLNHSSDSISSFSLINMGPFFRLLTYSLIISFVDGVMALVFGVEGSQSFAWWSPFRGFVFCLTLRAVTRPCFLSTVQPGDSAPQTALTGFHRWSEEQFFSQVNTVVCAHYLALFNCHPSIKQSLSCKELVSVWLLVYFDDNSAIICMGVHRVNLVFYKMKH